MKECFTEAVVLGVKPQGEYDRLVDLYTKELGRIEARVVSGRRISSKLAPHFNLGNKVLVRLVYKNQFTVTDVLEEEIIFSKLKKPALALKASNLIFLLRSLTPTAAPDLNLWHRLVASFRVRNFDFKIFLKILGYDALLARCDDCGSSKIHSFVASDQVFSCEECLKRIGEREVVPIN